MDLPDSWISSSASSTYVILRNNLHPNHCRYLSAHCSTCFQQPFCFLRDQYTFLDLVAYLDILRRMSFIICTYDLNIVWSFPTVPAHCLNAINFKYHTVSSITFLGTFYLAGNTLLNVLLDMHHWACHSVELFLMVLVTVSIESVSLSSIRILGWCYIAQKRGERGAFHMHLSPSNSVELFPIMLVTELYSRVEFCHVHLYSNESRLSRWFSIQYRNFVTFKFQLMF